MAKIKEEQQEEQKEHCLNAFCNPPPITIFKQKNKRLSIVWKDRFNVEYEILEEEYPNAQYDTTFQDYLNQGYQLEQLVDDTNNKPIYGFQDKKKPKSQQIRDLKNDIDQVNKFVQDSYNSYVEQQQEQQEQQQEQSKGDPNNND